MSLGKALSRESILHFGTFTHIPADAGHADWLSLAIAIRFRARPERVNAAIRRPDHAESSVIFGTAFKDSGKFVGYLRPVLGMYQLKELFVTTAEACRREPKERVHPLVPIHGMIVRMEVPGTHA